MPEGVLVLGNIVFDVVVRPVDELKWNATVWVDSMEESLGGNGASTSYAIGILGVPVRLMAYAGHDAAGEFAMRRLAAAGVDTRFVVHTDQSTASTAAIVNSSGARALLHRPGVSLDAFPESPEFTPGLIHGCQWFHLANAYSLPRVRPQAGEILKRARAAGLKTSVDTGWDSRGEWLRVLEPCLPHCDLLFVNDDEARRLSGLEDIGDAAALFLRLGAKSVVVKMGAAGCAAFGEAGEFRSPAIPVDVVDTTGAGDCFVGGFLAALCRGLPSPEAARIANAVGALSVAGLGATAGLKTWDETLAWLG